MAAGVEHPIVLAPFEMAHPSEYELRPGDIPKLMKAEAIVYAGYEVMTERLRKGLDLPEEKLLLIDTDYNAETIEQSVMRIAVRLNTEAVARQNLQEIRRALEESRIAVEKKNLRGQPAIVHRFQASIARELGLVPVLLFGPGAPEAAEIATAAKTKSVLIIDNLHNPVGRPFHEVLPDARYVRLLNFPGLHHTQTLTDVIRYNASQLIQPI
jgi:zinc transport system substrate-binding protein